MESHSHSKNLTRSDFIAPDTDAIWNWFDKLSFELKKGSCDIEKAEFFLNKLFKVPYFQNVITKPELIEVLIKIILRANAENKKDVLDRVLGLTEQYHFLFQITFKSQNRRYRETCLQDAVINGNFRLIKIFLESGVNVEPYTEHSPKNHPIILALHHKEVKILGALLQAISISSEAVHTPEATNNHSDDNKSISNKSSSSSSISRTHSLLGRDHKALIGEIISALKNDEKFLSKCLISSAKHGFSVLLQIALQQGADINPITNVLDVQTFMKKEQVIMGIVKDNLSTDAKAMLGDADNDTLNNQEIVLRTKYASDVWNNRSTLLYIANYGYPVKSAEEALELARFIGSFELEYFTDLKHKAVLMLTYIILAEDALKTEQINLKTKKKNTQSNPNAHTEIKKKLVKINHSVDEIERLKQYCLLILTKKDSAVDMTDMIETFAASKLSYTNLDFETDVLNSGLLMFLVDIETKCHTDFLISLQWREIYQQLGSDRFAMELMNTPTENYKSIEPIILIHFASSVLNTPILSSNLSKSENKIGKEEENEPAINPFERNVETKLGKIPLDDLQQKALQTLFTLSGSSTLAVIELAKYYYHIGNYQRAAYFAFECKMSKRENYSKAYSTTFIDLQYRLYLNPSIRSNLHSNNKSVCYFIIESNFFKTQPGLLTTVINEERTKQSYGYDPQSKLTDETPILRVLLKEQQQLARKAFKSAILHTNQANLLTEISTTGNATALFLSGCLVMFNTSLQSNPGEQSNLYNFKESLKNEYFTKAAQQGHQLARKMLSLDKKSYKTFQKRWDEFSQHHDLQNCIIQFLQQYLNQNHKTLFSIFKKRSNLFLTPLKDYLQQNTKLSIQEIIIKFEESTSLLRKKESDDRLLKAICFLIKKLITNYHIPLSDYDLNVTRDKQNTEMTF